MTPSPNIFWFAVGAMTGAAALWVALPLLRTVRERVAGRKMAVAVVGSLALAALIVTGLYRLWGTPAALTIDQHLVTSMDAMQQPRGGAPSTGTTRVGSVEEATAKLAERLKTKGGSSADWMLLAQSYDFLGRGEDAKQARARAGNGTSGAAVAGAPIPGAPAAGTPAGAASRVSVATAAGAGAAGATAASFPAAVDLSSVSPIVSAASKRLLADAEKHRIAHEYPQAIDDYRRLVPMHAMTADAWANYADAAASGNGGKLAGSPGDSIAQALQLDPDHPKALWLQASLLHELKRYDEAVDVWQHLAKILPAGSSDAQIVAANIAEAQRLANGVDAAPNAAPASGDAPVRISGEVDLDPALRAKAVSAATLFVIAKSVDSPGPPLAVMRTSVGAWPMKFSLNDSQAMLPQRKLSDFHRVIVEARISFSGQPLSQRGDLQGSSPALDPKNGRPIRVVIRDVIG